MTDGPFRVLVICTANICRSPMAERLLQRAAGERGLELDVSSAGFLFNGEPASAKTAAVMAECGIDLGDHRSRTVSPELVEQADLVVTMERGHARDLILENPSARDRVHTLGGMADALAEADPSAETPASSRVAQVLRDRPAGDLLGNGPDEVGDPHGRSKRRHRLARDRIVVLVDALLDGLFASPEDGADEP